MSKDQFKTRLEIAKKKISKKKLFNNKNNPSPIGAAFKLSTELVSAVVVGTIIGFIFDKTFGTKPWFILIFFLAISKRVDISLKSFILFIYFLVIQATNSSAFCKSTETS